MLEKFKQIKADLEKKVMSSDILLKDCCFMDQNVKKTFVFNDSTFFPFYYYLGKYINPKNLLVLGADAGLTTACFLKSSPVENILCFQEHSSEEHYGVRVCAFNIMKQCNANLDIYCGSMLDDNFLKKISSKKWDCILVNLNLNYDKLRNYLDVAWEHLVLDGIMLIESELSDHTIKATQDFLQITQRDYLTFDTRYKAILVTK